MPVLPQLNFAPLVEYTLSYARHGETNFTTFATGHTSITNGVLGRLDTSRLLNDIYDIRLRAEDSQGRIVTLTTAYLITGNLKLGNFSFSVQDLIVPIIGLPIAIIRSYDSRETAQGDFGIGWKLDVQSVTLRENQVLGQNWVQERTDIGIISYYCVEPVGEHFVSVSLPDGRVETFDFLPLTPESSRNDPNFGELPVNCQFVTPISSANVTFVPRPGTRGTLEALGDTDLLTTPQEDPVELIDTDANCYDPSSYRLTTSDGMVVEFDQNFGVLNIAHPSKGTLTFGNDGIIHSGGLSVDFVRDTEGRITQITPPGSNPVIYEYDTNGDLVAVTDQDNRQTRYIYDDNHKITEIEDPRGLPAARNIYDDSGRLIALIDAEGNRIDFTSDVDGRQEIITDRLNNPTIYIYDDQGNTLSETNALGHETTFTYDDDGNVLTRTDPLDHTTTFTYDDQGNVLTITNELGHQLEFTDNEFGNILTAKDTRNRARILVGGGLA